MLLKACTEQEYHAGMGKLLDDENNAGVVNRSSSLVKYDGISKQHIPSQRHSKEWQRLHVYRLPLPRQVCQEVLVGALLPRELPGAK